MNFPFYMQDAFGTPTALALGTLIGFGFGFALERAGFGRATVLAAQFYFTDNRVLKVMFSAIVTALLGLTVLDGLGWVDMAAMVVPPTFLWPQLVGGLLLGVGFIVSGYCPGTSVVATASGKLDGLATFAGVAVGAVGFGYLFPSFEGFYSSGSLGVLRFTDLLGVPTPWLAAGVAAMAVGAFLGVEILERKLARERHAAAPAGSPRVRDRVFQGFAAATVIAFALLLVPAGAETEAARTVGRIDAVTLARTLVEDPGSVYVVDLRDREAYEAERIPGALAPAAQDTEAAFVADLPLTRRVVLYGAGDLERLPAGAERYPGTLQVVEGGYAAFTEQVLTAPEPPASGEESAMAEYRTRYALHGFFTGVEAAPPPAAPVKVIRAKKKKGAGC